MFYLPRVPYSTVYSNSDQAIFLFAFGLQAWYQAQIRWETFWLDHNGHNRDQTLSSMDQKVWRRSHFYWWGRWSWCHPIAVFIVWRGERPTRRRGRRGWRRTRWRWDLRAPFRWGTKRSSDQPVRPQRFLQVRPICRSQTRTSQMKLNKDLSLIINNHIIYSLNNFCIPYQNI